jgi:hypothetical protein
MATRKTIRVNPLDSLVPDSTTHQTPTLRNQPKTKGSHIPTVATQIAQPPSSSDLSSRIQSLEEQNKYISWLLGGAILLAVLL